MNTPQDGIFETGSRYHYHLEVIFPEGMDPGPIRAALTEIRGMGTAEATIILSLGKSLWSRLKPANAGDGWIPADWRDFETVGAGARSAPGTQADLWIWVQGDRHDLNFEAALACRNALPDGALISVEIPAFVFKNSLDLSGFIDGTANPKEDERQAVALIPDGQVGAGGAFSMTQRWVHDLAPFLALDLDEQARIFGRTKIKDEELEGDAMPADSHVSRTDVKVDGVAMKLWRRSTPYGTTAEHGLYFIGFACEQRRFQVLLERMFGVSGDGIHDRLTDFSKAVSGSYWFTPSSADLDRAVAG